MAAIVEFPSIVETALDEFADLLPNEPQRRHFAEYLTGLYVAARKSVSVRQVERWLAAGKPRHKYGQARNSTVRIPVLEAELWLSGLTLGQDSA